MFLFWHSSYALNYRANFQTSKYRNKKRLLPRTAIAMPTCKNNVQQCRLWWAFLLEFGAIAAAALRYFTFVVYAIYALLFVVIDGLSDYSHSGEIAERWNKIIMTHRLCIPFTSKNKCKCALPGIVAVPCNILSNFSLIKFYSVFNGQNSIEYLTLLTHWFTIKFPMKIDWMLLPLCSITIF